MTPDAPVHINFLCLADPIHPGDIPVADPAVYVPGEMRLVAEVCKIRHVVDALPFYGLALAIVAYDLGYGPELRRYDFVTQIAFLHRRYARMIGHGGIGVAEEAAQLFACDVNVVAEGDRLRGRRGIVEFAEYHHQKPRNQNQRKRRPYYLCG